ncbi:MAG: O-antigen ligase family protein [bacterium]|nr:O-antigen ligase family protein [bacterium]
MFEVFKKPINSVYALQLLLVFLIALGGIDRIWAWAILFMLYAFIQTQPLKESVLLFSRSIPFYIALPITASFDSFNMWRIVVILIALKWFFIVKKDALNFLKQRITKNNLRALYAQNKIEILGLLIFALAFISLGKSVFLFAGAKRLFYFINLSLIFPVIVWVFKNRLITIAEISKNIAISIALIVGIGFLQLLSAYFLNLTEFMMFWAGQIQTGFYGTNWSNIVFSGNTWFSYNTGEFPKLRMFSSFPDSHTFPLYILFGLPALIAIFFDKIKNLKLEAKNWIASKEEYLCLGALLAAFLAVVLSGTRGIWLAVLLPLSFIFIQKKIPGLLDYFNLSQEKSAVNSGIIKKNSAIILIFFIALALSYPILAKDQFFLKTETSTQQGMILNRVMSIIDASETSNNLRLEIWKKSFASVVKNPLLGVGIGNFPVVLSQNISALKAGASAHNLYLNILAETGIFSLILFLAICVLILKYSWEIFQKAADEKTKIYGYAFFLYSLWIFGYNLTDAALFDEREFLMFILTVGIIVGVKKQLGAKIKNHGQ